MIHRVALTDAQNNLGSLVRRARHDRECFILEEDGVPVAGILNFEEMEDYLELQNQPLRRQIRAGYAAYRRGKARNGRDFLDQVRRRRKK